MNVQLHIAESAILEAAITMTNMAKRITALESTLIECREYFSQRIDCDHDDYGSPVPNPEMKLLCEIDELLVPVGAQA